jgi:hypothetical protein
MCVEGADAGLSLGAIGVYSFGCSGRGITNQQSMQIEKEETLWRVEMTDIAFPHRGQLGGGGRGIDIASLYRVRRGESVRKCTYICLRRERR